MTLTAIVRVSFQSNANGNYAVEDALTKDGIFNKVGTAAFHCQNKENQEVIERLKALAQALDDHQDSIDFASVSIVSER